VWVLRALAGLAGVIVLVITAFVARESLPALRDVGAVRFLTDASWHPSASSGAGSYNLLPMLAGSLLAMLGAVLLATPLGILSAVFCQFYAPRRLAGAYRNVIGLLAGIPSVVYGFWGLVVLVPLIRHLAPPGASLLAGVLILTIMIVPTIALTADAAIASVPAAYLRGAAALGLSRAATLIGVVLPAARSGLYTGALLAAARAIGETMAILMVCGNVVEMPASVFDPIRTLTANIALEMAYAVGDHRSSLFVSGLVLLAFVALLVAWAEYVGRERAHA
jgi:phosphate transport system permease protein